MKYSLAFALCCLLPALASAADQAPRPPQAPPVVARETCDCNGPTSCTCDPKACKCVKCVLANPSRVNCYRYGKLVCSCTSTSGRCQCPNCPLKAWTDDPQCTCPGPDQCAHHYCGCQTCPARRPKVSGDWIWRPAEGLWQSQSDPSHWFDPTPAAAAPAVYAPAAPVQFQQPVLSSFRSGGGGC